LSAMTIASSNTIPGPRRSPAPARRRVLTRRRSFSTCVTIRSSTAKDGFEGNSTLASATVRAF
jgi:hypothetical protein